MEHRIHPASRDHGDPLMLRLQTPFQDGGRGLTHQRDAAIRKPSTHQAPLVRPHPDGRVPRAQACAHLRGGRQHAREGQRPPLCGPGERHHHGPDAGCADSTLSQECLRVLIVRPQRRCSVSSMTRSTPAPAGTTDATRSKSPWQRTARGLDGGSGGTGSHRLSGLGLWHAGLFATVRRPRASSVPVHHVIRVLQVGAGHHGRTTANTSRMGSGRGRKRLLRSERTLISSSFPS